MKKIIYIGNNLTEKSKYHSAMATLSQLLAKEGYLVIKSSDKFNKLVRLADMCFTVIKHRKTTNVVLIDTFSTYNFYYTVIVAVLCRLFSLKYIPILHGGNLPWRLDHSPKLAAFIFKNSYKNVSPSPFLQHEFQQRKMNAICIPNPIDISTIPFTQRKNEEVSLLWVRAFDKTYNPLLAIKVLSRLRKTFNNATLCMVGPDKDGSLKKTKKLAFDLQVSSWVTFTDVLSRKEWHKLSKNYNIFINTSNVDNTPVSIMEAMALGLPVISTDVGGIKFLISHNNNGILVSPNNEEQMEKAVLKLVNEVDFANQLVKNAREKVVNFDLNKVSVQWNKLLKDV